MKPTTESLARKAYIPVIIGEIARCDASIEIICEDIVENGISLDSWIVLKHTINEKQIFAEMLED